MDDYSIKVLSWIGISMVITYRMYYLNSTNWISQKLEKITYSRRKPYDGVSELIRKNIEKLSVSITQDTDFLITWIRGVEQTSAIWKTVETKTLPESIKFQMVSVDGESPEVAYRIILLPKPTGDKEALIKRMKENEENVTVCDKEENDTLTEWISDNRETIIKSIRKDTMTFIEIIKGDNKLSDESMRQDIEIVSKTPCLSCRSMFRHYSIILSKTTSNKATSTEEDKETMTEGSLQDKEMMTTQTTQIRELFEPGCPSALDRTPTTITLTWNESIVGADCYEIKCEQKDNSVVCYYKTSDNSCKYIVKGLKRNTEYEFTIRAVKNEVNKGPYSKALKVSTSVISNYSIAEFLYVLFYIEVFIWFTYLFCYIVFIK